MKPLFTIAALALLAGCATTPPEDRAQALPVAVPEAWQADAALDAAAFRAGWLADFDAPGLAELVTGAVENNWNLRQAAARVEIARAERGIARAGWLPSLSGSGEAGRQRTVTNAGPLGTQAATTDRYSIGLGVRWEVDIWGRLRSLDKAAIAELQAAEADLHGARLSLAAQVARTYFDLAEAREQATLARGTWQSFADNAALIEERFQRGVGSALDLRLTRASAQNAHAAYLARLREADALDRALAVLLGQYPANALEAEPALPHLETPPPAGLPAQMLARRPDLIAAERALAAAGMRERAANKALLPRLSLTSSVGTASDELRDLSDGDFRVWSLLANLSAPIWQGGALRADIDRAEAAETLQLAAYAQTALDAFREVENALAAEDFLRQQEEATGSAAQEAQAAEALAWERYTRGLENINTALQAQRTAFEERSRYLSLRNARLQNRVNLYLSLGGDFMAPLEAPEATNEPF